LEERIEPEKGHQFLEGAVSAADSGLCMRRRKEIRMGVFWMEKEEGLTIDQRTEWGGGKASPEPRVEAND
jgi:hypothetical protein